MAVSECGTPGDVQLGKAMVCGTMRPECSQRDDRNR
jgi:hypothetical protein